MLRILPIFVSILLVGADALWAANKDFERLYLQVAALQSELAEARRILADQQREIRRLNEALAEQNAMSKKAIEDQRVQTAAVQDTLQRLNDVLHTLQSRLATDARPATLSTAVAGEPSGENPTATSQAPPAEQELYTQAYADCARGNYDLGIQAYQEFLRLYPSSPLSDNAQYRIGECHFGKQKYAEAIAAWDELLRQYPATDMIPDTRFKKAKALEKLGRRSQALLEYRFVAEHFPNSEVGRKAREQIQPR